MQVYRVDVSHWFNGRLASTIFFPPQNHKVVVAGTVGGSGPDLLLITPFLKRSFVYLDCSVLYFCNLFIHKPLCMPCFSLQFSYSHTHIPTYTSNLTLTHTHTEFPTSFFFWCVFLFCSIHRFHQLSVFKITQQRQQQYTTIQFSWQWGGPTVNRVCGKRWSFQTIKPQHAVEFHHTNQGKLQA